MSASVYRFVLFDSVLYDRCELKGSWTRWEPCGRSYFYWCLALFVVSCAGSSLIIGLPVLFAWRAGLFHHPGEHLAASDSGRRGASLPAHCVRVVERDHQPVCQGFLHSHHGNGESRRGRGLAPAASHDGSREDGLHRLFPDENRFGHRQRHHLRHHYVPVSLL